MKFTQITKSISCVVLTSYACMAHSQSLPVDKNETLTIGALATFGQSEYAVDDKTGIAPLFLYDNNRLYLEGTEAGFYAYKDHQHWLRGGLSYDTRHFDPDNATGLLKGLDERKTSVNAHASYMYISPIGGFEFKVATDVLGRSNAQTFTVAHRSKFDVLDNTLTIYPKIGATWHSKDYNNYYYGVSAKESALVDIAPYTAKSSYSPFVSVSAKYKITQHLGLFGSQHVEWLSATQKDSPLTDDKLKSIARLGITYTF